MKNRIMYYVLIEKQVNRTLSADKRYDDNSNSKMRE
jgi:hypothetical protein